MNKNYYDILEVNKNASPEIIEKAYKTLVKKYHPDLQENNLKNIYEEKIKKINEAYDILSNQEKRKNYDLFLKNNEISNDDYNNLKNENINLKNEINYLKNNYKKNLNYNNLENNNINNNYENLNKKNIKNNNFNIFNYKNYDYNNLIKNCIAFILTCIIILIISFILWHIPISRNYLINLYNTNNILKSLINSFINIFK